MKAKTLGLVVAVMVLLSTGCTSKSKKTEAIATSTVEKESYYSGQPLKIAVIGLVHTHVHWILGREDLGDIEIVGIVEPNRALAQTYSEQHGYSMDIVFDTMEALYKKVQPDAVTAFNTIYGHLEVVEFFAPKGIHVMVEKPLAVNWEHAQKMAALAKANNIHLLTNYETSWYASNYDAYNRVIENKEIGAVQRMVFHHGHPGPIEIGCNEEFLVWLTDPILNGGGALTDFGCYGANLATWFLKGQSPKSVTAITRNYKPEKYPKVDDDATIVLDYEETQVIIQASWNWSHNRKDMEVYGKSGYVICKNGENMEVLLDEKKGALTHTAKPLELGVHDPFAFLNKVVQENETPPSFSVSALDNNLLVMQILEIAKASAEKGESLEWDAFFTQSQL